MVAICPNGFTRHFYSYGRTTTRSGYRTHRNLGPVRCFLLRKSICIIQSVLWNWARRSSGSDLQSPALCGAVSRAAGIRSSPCSTLWSCYASISKQTLAVLTPLPVSPGSTGEDACLKSSPTYTSGLHGAPLKFIT